MRLKIFQGYKKDVELEVNKHLDMLLYPLGDFDPDDRMSLRNNYEVPKFITQSESALVTGINETKQLLTISVFYE